jgi:G3E family GTPase
MQVNLLFGFLGSGKTTLVKRLLAERARDARTAVIVNEFGEVGIDGEILRGDNVDMVELNSGCMCCTLKGSLLLAIEELQQKAGVERVIVEATGVAQPAELLETLADPSFRARIDIGPLVTVVDAAKFTRLRNALGDFYEAQIENADILILNKADLADAGQLEKVREEAVVLNPKATVLLAEQCDVDSRLLLDGDFSNLVQQTAERTRAGADLHRNAPHNHDHGHDDTHAHPHAPAESFVLDAGGECSRGEVEAFFRALPENVWRAKGFMRIDGRPCLVQFSMGQLEITPDVPRAHYNMVFIGRRLDRRAVSQHFAFAANTGMGASEAGRRG